MKIKFLGAARAVTGSCFIIETDKTRFAVDCGMHQGSAEIEKRNWEVDIYDPSKNRFFPYYTFSYRPLRIASPYGAKGVSRSCLRN